MNIQPLKINLQWILLITIALIVISCSKNEEIILESYRCNFNPKNSYSDEMKSFLNCSDPCNKFSKQMDSGEFVKITQGFIINNVDKTVLEKIYRNNKVMDSTVYENCKIFNNENWDCSYVSTDSNIYEQVFRKMNNKIFSSYNIKRVKGEENISIGLCAK
jgi:hypothetical protein